jgi:hypothetical protein
VLGSYARTWGRFLLPLLPYLAIAAAFAVGQAVRWLTPRAASTRARVALASFAALAVLALPVYAGLRRFTLQLRSDTIERACTWIAEHVDPRAARILVGQSLTLPLFHRADALQSNLQYKSAQYSRWLCYQDLVLEPAPPERGFQLLMVPQHTELRQQLRRSQGAVDYLRASAADYLVLEVSQRTVAFLAQRQLRDAARQVGGLVASFAPDPDAPEDIRWADYQDGPGMVWRTLRQDCLGPTIEIYRLAPDRGAAATPSTK